MKHAAFIAAVFAAGCPAAALAQPANACKSAVVADCLKQLSSQGWRHQLVKEPDPKVADASVQYDVWVRSDDAMFCIRSYWRGNNQGSMNCSPLKRVTN